MTAGHSSFDYETAAQVFRVLRARATLYAVVGTLIAIIAVVLATLLVCVHVYDGITTNNIMLAHRENIAIQALDAMPFLFTWWGQYASSKMAAEAGSMVERRTDDLKQELADARFTAQAKTDFFARMSHELRTPINAIVGMSELVMNTDDPEQRRHHAQVIHDSAYGLLTLVNDVLDFSRIEAGRMELDDVGFDLYDHLNGTATLLDQQARAKGLRLVSLIPPDTPRRVVGDPGRLRQIVINLVGNAIKFTSEGEVVLAVKRWEALEAGGVRIRVEVADTGTGIPAEAQERLFEPYSRVGTETIEGTGLGLSITRDLVAAMDGEIGVDSEPGVGSVFWFEIQLGAARAPDREGPAPRLRGRKVLLADPDADQRTALASQLRTLGMWVTQAGDGVEAMQMALRAAADGTPYDLLLAELFLPCLSGEELGRRLKRRPETCSTSLAIMTATGARGDAKRLNEAGFAGYLTRPIPPENLEELVQAILATHALPEAERRRQGLVTRYHVEETYPHAAVQPVLVVDDSAINREITLHHLSRLGIDADQVDTGARAVEAVGSRDYAAVLMDLRLPDMHGAEAIQTIRRNGAAQAAPPILVLTAGATTEERERCEQAGIEAFMTRPLEGDGLRSALAPWIGARVDSTNEPDAAAMRAPDPKLARVFVQEADERIGAMRTVLAGNADLDVLGRHAHTIGSTSRHFPGTELTDIARQIEARANAGDLDGVRAEFPDLETAWSTLRADLIQGMEAEH
ncbi:hybrid sensor histidine kinase/response regulator [Halofilum ochraceum]|uniref:hybrid sensor histidine kinase/response regulator n=1 Tax=Halofilum ochraceum TaxID=1611323 RepID=UPI0008DB3059|nr:hybrid sensor histidine kinase/response regulator [Halofilum ochraceum]